MQVSAIRKLALNFNVQVIATTHSRECIEAAYEAFGDRPGEQFKYHRLDRVDGEIRAITYSDEAFAGAAKFNVEVR